MPGEFDLIRRFFSDRLPPRRDTRLGVGDDCALLRPPAGMDIALSVDTLVSGVHFLPTVDPDRLGHKALAVNLSDLAAMGAEPAWATLALTLPEADEVWLAGFSEGFFRLASRFGLELVGGDTTRGPLSLTVQVMGMLPQGKALRRSGARPGDGVYVSGSPGRAGLGLKGRLKASIWADADSIDALELPEPRINLGLALRGLASACIDISDGLAQDLGHVLTASQVGARIDYDQLPLSPAVHQYVTASGDWALPLSAGDDYELCFTLPPHKVAELESRLSGSGLSITQIGHIEPEPGLRLLKHHDIHPLEVAGYDHFPTH